MPRLNMDSPAPRPDSTGGSAGRPDAGAWGRGRLNQAINSDEIRAEMIGSAPENPAGRLGGMRGDLDELRASMGEAAPSYGAEAPDIAAPNPTAPDIGPSHRQTAWEKTKQALKDTFWSKEDRKAAVISGATIGIIRAGINWGTGGIGLIGSAGVGAIAGGGRALFQDIYRQHEEQKSGLRQEIENKESRGEDISNDETRLYALEDIRFRNVAARWRAADKERLKKVVIGAAVWGGLGGVVGFEIKEFGIADFIRKAFTAEHGIMRTAAVAGSSITGAIAGFAGERTMELRERDKLPFYSRMTTRARRLSKRTAAMAVLGAVAGFAIGEVGAELMGFGPDIKMPKPEAPAAAPTATATGTPDTTPAGKPTLTEVKPTVFPEPTATATPRPFTPTVEAAATSAPVIATATATETSIPTPTATAVATETVAPLPTATATETATPAATSTPTRVPPSTPTETPTRVPTNTPTPEPARPAITPTPKRPGPISSLPDAISLASLDLKQDIVPISYTQQLIPDQMHGLIQAQGAGAVSGGDADTSKLANLIDVSNKEWVEAKGADNYAEELKKNIGKPNPFNPKLGIVRPEDVEDAEKDARFQWYERAKANEKLVATAQSLGPKLESIQEDASRQYGESQGAASYAQTIENNVGNPNPVDPKLGSVRPEDVDSAKADAAREWVEANTARRNVDVIRFRDRYVPDPKDLVPPEEANGLDNIFTLKADVKPGSSFWQSFKIPDEYFANGEEHGWVNPENGVTQEDVIKDMLRKFAIANGHPIDRIGAGTVSLEDLDLTDEQEFAIRKALSTRTAGQYIREGAMSTFQAALKKAA